MRKDDELYMQRCIQLAELGAGQVAPNPMVGSILVFEGRIIGEGYHRTYGEAHAEVNCIASVKDADRHLIERSVLYVSLEPCAHYGKTPPCSDLIIKQKIPKVVIGCRDPFDQVNGKGIEKLKAAGVEVITGVLEDACQALNKRFFTFHTKQRPYIILKWSQTANNKIAYNNNNRLFISNEFANRMVHKWRFEEAGILVGTNTVLADNPSLTNRLWTGKNPVRLVLDKRSKFTDRDLKIFNAEAPTILFNEEKTSIDAAAPLLNQVYFYKAEKDKSLPLQIAEACYALNIQSILVEGGATLLQSFIDENLFDEIRVITNTDLAIEDGLDAPVLSQATTVFSSEASLLNRIEIFL